MRIVVDAMLGVGNPDHPERLDGAIASLGAIGLLMQADGLANLAADGEDRVERGHRLLEDHRDARAAYVAHLEVAQLQQILILENYFAAHDTRRLGQQPHDREHARRLARSRLTDNAEQLARLDGKT